MNGFTRAVKFAWGLYAWLCFALACLSALLVTLVVPGLDRRRRWVSIAVRAMFVMAGIRVNIRGLDNLPADSCVVVANHASYVDGLLLRAYLPSRFGIVIKGEMRDIPVVHFLLRRSGSKFVERKEAAGSARDARQIVKAALGGESLAVFPEGTFHLEPGIHRFRRGAFVAAIKGNMPVVPVALSGTREMMPAERLVPRNTELTLDILSPINPSDAAFAKNRTLAEVARQRILAVLDEPDLLDDTP